MVELRITYNDCTLTEQYIYDACEYLNHKIEEFIDFILKVKDLITDMMRRVNDALQELNKTFERLFGEQKSELYLSCRKNQNTRLFYCPYEYRNNFYYRLSTYLTLKKVFHKARDRC